MCGCGHSAERYKRSPSGERCCLDCGCTDHEITMPSTQLQAESFTTNVGITYNVGDTVVVDRSVSKGQRHVWCLARVERITPKRIKVAWLDNGQSSYVTKEAIR